VSGAVAKARRSGAAASMVSTWLASAHPPTDAVSVRAPAAVAEKTNGTVVAPPSRVTLVTGVPQAGPPKKLVPAAGSALKATARWLPGAEGFP